MTEAQVLTRWGKIVGAASQEHNLAGFFQKFRPHGDGLTEALKGVAGADEILPRLLDVYEATAEGWEEGDAYFVVRSPKTLAKEQAKQFAASYLHKMEEVARAVGNSELIRILQGRHRIEVVSGKTPWPPGQGDPETLLYEARADFMLSLAPMESHMLLLDDALYHIACDYFLRDYILWPLYSRTTAITDPFEPYFRMWQHGAGIRFQGDDLIKAFVPVSIPKRPSGRDSED